MGLNFVGMAPYCKKTDRQRNLQENRLVRSLSDLRWKMRKNRHCVRSGETALLTKFAMEFLGLRRTSRPLTYKHGAGIVNSGRISLHPSTPIMQVLHC